MDLHEFELPPGAHAENLVELTLQAMLSHDGRFDWSWVMCAHIRGWEQDKQDVLRQSQISIPHSQFAWYHWHEICDRTLIRAENELDLILDVISDPDLRKNKVAIARYCHHMIDNWLHPECERQFERHVQALEEHGLI